MLNVLEQVQIACLEAGVAPNAESISKIVRSLYPATSHTELVDLVDQVLSSVFGLGPLEELLYHPNLTDILVNRFDDIWIDRGNGLEKTEIRFRSEGAAQDFAKRMATLGHRRLDDAQPFVDIQTEGGLRFHAMLPPISASGVAISIRTPSPFSISLEDMFVAGNLTKDDYQNLCEVIETQKSFIISGGTGSGKTTLLAAMLAKVPVNQRIISIEDSSELSIQHPHVVSVQSRLMNSEGAGGISMADLVRQSLRMRPDRIVVGEVRGKEISDLLLALNTGHKGSGTTIHADSADSVPTRIEALGLMAGLPREAIHAQMYCAFDVVIQMKDARDGTRGVCEFAKLVRTADGTVRTEPVTEFHSLKSAA